jgi:exonuclease SbcC
VNISSIDVTNYRAIARAQLDFTQIRGAVIAGENGSGKSSLIEALFWCLFGESRSGRRADGVVRLGADTCEVTVVFEAAGDRWKVKRTRTTRGRGKSSLDLWRWEPMPGLDGAWAPKTGKNIEGEDGDSQAVLESALKIGYETLVNGPIMLQNDAARFCVARPEERRDILRQILNLEQYRVLQQAALGKAGALQAEAANLRKALAARGDTAAALESAKERVAVADQARLDAGFRVSDAEKALAAAREHVTLLRVAHDEQHRAAEKVRGFEADIVRYEGQIREADGELRHLDHLVTEVPSIEAAQARVPTLEAAEEQIVARLAEASGRAERRAALEAKRTAAAEDWRAAKRRHDEAQAAAAGLTEAEAEANALESRQAAAGEQRARLDAARQIVEARRQGLDDASRARFDIDSAPEIQAAQAAIAQAKADLEARETEQATAATSLHEAGRKAQEAAIRVRLVAERIEACGIEVARLERRTALLGEVPCASDGSELWEPVDGLKAGRPCDLAGTCKLLADARGAAAELITQRERLAGLTREGDEAAVVRQETGAAEFEATEALKQVQIAVRDATGRRLQAEDAMAAIRTRLRDDVQRRVDAAQAALREAEAGSLNIESMVREAEEAMRRAERAADAVQTKRAAAQRQADEHEALARIVREGEAIRGEIEQLGAPYDLPALREQLRQARFELENTRRTAARLEGVRAALAQRVPTQERIAAYRAALASAKTHLETARPDPQIAEKLAGRQQEEREAESSLGDARARATAAEREHSGAEEAMRQAQETHQKTLDETAYCERREEMMRTWQKTAEALHLAAVVLIERAIPVIEHKANEVLAQVSSRGMRLTLETQRANKTVEGARETLDVIIDDAAGRRPYEDYSGGEQFRANLALRLGLAQLLADREGVPIECVIIDEGGFGALDPTGVAAMKEVVAALLKHFRLVLLVTHIPDVADCLPSLIRVTPGPEGSNVRLVA